MAEPVARDDDEGAVVSERDGVLQRHKQELKELRGKSLIKYYLAEISLSFPQLKFNP